MGFVKEFREFAVKGNVVDLAVGIIIGGAFGKIVSSIVADVIMPPVGLLVGGVNFTNLKWTMKAATESAPAVTLNYGQFLQTVVDFTIVAFSVFLLVKAINTLRQRLEDEKPVAPPATPQEQILLAEIRDLLRDGNRNRAANN